MGFLTSFKELFFQNTAPKKQDETVPASADIRRKIYERQMSRVKADIQRWRSAVSSAESIENPQRVELYRIYNEVVLDAYLTSLMQIRKNSILSTKYVVKKNGKVDLKKTEFINTKWFRDFLSLAFDSKFWGHSVIQFGQYKNGSFREIQLIPRQNIKPEFQIAVENPWDNFGTDYTTPKYKKWLIEVGEKRDLGLLLKAAPLVIWKKGALAAWSVFCESFGVPLRILQTDKKDPGVVAEFEDMLKNLAASAYGIIGKEDILTMHEVKNTDSFQVFEQLIERVNKELGLLFVGSAALADSKNFVGSAEVSERLFKTFNLVDDYFIDDILKHSLIPLLNAHGLGFNGYTICAENDDVLSFQEKARFDINLLKTYDIPAEYILEMYGTPVIPRTNNKVDTKDNNDTGDIESDKEKEQEMIDPNSDEQ